jgi:hypothetical protein
LGAGFSGLSGFGRVSRHALRAHPQDCDFPLLSRHAATTVSLPQSHRQSQSA